MHDSLKLVSKGEEKLQQKNQGQQTTSNLTPEQTHFLKTVDRLFGEKIIDQLEYLCLVTPSVNGKREWLVSADEDDLIQPLIENAKPYNF